MSVVAKCLALVLVAVITARFTGLQNGDFGDTDMDGDRNDVDEWAENEPLAGEIKIVDDASDPGANSLVVKMGPSVGWGLTLSQEFDCAGPEDQVCMVSFSYKWNPAENSKDRFFVSCGGAVIELSAASTWTDKHLAVGPCGEKKELEFFVLDDEWPKDKIESEAYIDNVKCECRDKNNLPVLWNGQRQGKIDSGWLINIPTGSSDFFNVVYSIAPGLVNVDGGQVADGLPINGMAVSVTDFGSGLAYPVVGVFDSNLILDPAGNTPDLANPVSMALNPSFTPPPLFQFTTFHLPEASIPSGTTKIHAVAQLPPGDSGLLGVGADSTTSTAGTSGFTSDGYASPATMATFVDFGLNPGQDNSDTSSCKQSDRKPHGRLRASNLCQGIGEGDRLNTTIRSGQTLNLAFFGTRAGDKFRLYFATAPCSPAVAIGPLLPTLADPDGDGSYLRLNATWPSGYGGQTFRFSAVWGNAACAAPGVGFTNCVTVITRQDLTFGICDDGTIESGWIVQIPSGSSDYFNNNFGDGSSQHGIVALTLAVMDFGTASPAFPTAGISNASLSVDATGNTPDLGSPLACVCPFTFPPGTFATTSSAFISQPTSIPGGLLGTNVHGWVQFPPGDSGLLGIGGDSTQSNGCSFFTQDGYSSPALSFSVNWGIRVATN